MFLFSSTLVHIITCEKKSSDLATRIGRRNVNKTIFYLFFLFLALWEKYIFHFACFFSVCMCSRKKNHHHTPFLKGSHSKASSSWSPSSRKKSSLFFSSSASIASFSFSFVSKRKILKLFIRKKVNRGRDDCKEEEESRKSSNSKARIREKNHHLAIPRLLCIPREDLFLLYFMKVSAERCDEEKENQISFEMWGGIFLLDSQKDC